MSDVEVKVRIDAPAERVWSLVGDPTRMGEWSPECQRVEWKGGVDAPANGATFKGHNKLGWRRWSTAGKIVAFEPGREIAWDVNIGGMSVARWSYRVVPEGDACTLIEEFTDQRGSVVKVLGKVGRGVSDVATHNRAGMEHTLDQVKAAAEALPG